MVRSWSRAFSNPCVICARPSAVRAAASHRHGHASRAPRRMLTLLHDSSSAPSRLFLASHQLHRAGHHPTIKWPPDVLRSHTQGHASSRNKPEQHEVLSVRQTCEIGEARTSCDMRDHMYGGGRELIHIHAEMVHNPHHPPGLTYASVQGDMHVPGPATPAH